MTTKQIEQIKVFKYTKTGCKYVKKYISLKTFTKLLSEKRSHVGAVRQGKNHSICEIPFLNGTTEENSEK